MPISHTGLRVAYLFAAGLTLGLPGMLSGQSSWPQALGENTWIRGTPPDAPLCRAAKPTLRADSIGLFQIGMTIEEFMQECPMARRGWVAVEVEAKPAVAVELGAATIVGEFTDTLPESKLFFITASHPSVQTEDGLGPGATLQALRTEFGPATFTTELCRASARFRSLPGVGWALGFLSEEDCRLVRGSDPVPDEVAARLWVHWVYVHPN